MPLRSEEEIISTLRKWCFLNDNFSRKKKTAVHIFIFSEIIDLLLNVPFHFHFDMFTMCLRDSVFHLIYLCNLGNHFCFQWTPGIS